MSSRVLAVIPARLSSTRLPGKPLKQIGGKSMVQRVWECAKRAETLSRIVVACDDEKIFREVKNFGGEVIMTSESLKSGSERVSAAMEELGGGESWDIVANVQGDMPFVPSGLIDQTVRFFENEGASFDVATPCVPIEDEEEFLSASKVKVVVGAHNQALYFSRSPIPFSRDGERVTCSNQPIFGYKHIGLYLLHPPSEFFCLYQIFKRIYFN